MGSNPTLRIMVDVAQLVELPVVIRTVAGSSPVIHPKRTDVGNAFSRA